MMTMISLTQIKRSAYAFPLAALAALAMLFISETSYWQATDSMDDMGMMAQARTQINTLLRRLVDTETSQRGYLLTSRQEYLTPLNGAIDDSNAALKWLVQYYAKDAANQKSAQELQILTQRKLGEVAITIRLHDEGKEEAWRAMVLSNIGQQDMESVRAVATQLLESETTKVNTAREDVHNTLMLNRIGVAAMTAISFLALTMFLAQTNALNAQRLAQSQAIQAERDQLEFEVKRRTMHLTDLTRYLQTIREDERGRLARELHDELGALLTAAKLDAARIKSRLGTLTPELAERMAHLNDNLNEVIALKRRIVEDLCPSSLSTLGLVAALEIQSREFATRSGLQVDCHLNSVSLSPSASLTVYRLVQEAFTNIAKYAKAKTVTVDLSAQDGRACIAVKDDGVGFDPSQQPSSAHGLLGMRYRVEAEGGELVLQSAPGQGTRIGATVPLIT
ncbi:MAG: CHASE3 domain-containing protein [Aquabacterium sp.]|uniref:CHASE3 domain-containing protein n=1 Tax=Aquabacterium sp. TaxID=1872578 RepID=UPI0027190D14|nr:CHASE3 domain-containing protein [Aquabacterium sp.]MDO9002099.1 CHASE3 domain-containing protein [Aquabacterium sp.]